MNDQQRAVADAVKEALLAGLSIIWPKEDGSKAPDGNWKDAQAEPRSRDRLLCGFRERDRNGLMVVCGRVSGNLEVLDFENAEIYATFQAAMSMAGEEDLLERIEDGYQERCPRGGYHLPYRCEVIGGNRKLAFGENAEVLIETRGEGGCFMAAPSRFNGSAWTLMKGGFSTIATISVEERETVFRIARLQCRAPKQAEIPVFQPSSEPEREDRPGDDFNRRGSWGFLAEAGWTMVGELGSQQYWRRPGKDQGHSAVLHTDSQLFVPFSSSTPFPQTEMGYSRYRTYTYVVHGGDFSAASRGLRKAGYGGEREKSEPRIMPEYGQIMRANLLRDFDVPDLATLPLLGRDGFFIEGGSNLLYGFPKAGKTDLSMALIRDWIAEGRRVCYFSEEPLPFWKHRLAGLDDSWDFWEPLLIAEAMGWGIVKLLANFTDDDVVFVDTIRSVAGYRENKVDEDVGKIIEPMILAARERGATLIAGYHARKMPGEDGADISGHHSLFGAFDRAIQVKKMAGDDNDKKRKVKVFGRLLNPEQPDTLVYEMTGPCRFRPLDQKEATRLLTQLKPCAECGAEFTPSRKDARYCSGTCQRKAHRSVSGESDGE